MQNNIDVFVNPVNLTLQGKIGGAQDAAVAAAVGGGFGYGAMLGIPEVFVPAGFADSIYDPEFVLAQGRQELRRQGKRDAHEARRHRLAVQHRVLGRAGPGSGAAEGGVGVRGRDPSPQAAAGFGPVKGEAVTKKVMTTSR